MSTLRELRRGGQTILFLLDPVRPLPVRAHFTARSLRRARRSTTLHLPDLQAVPHQGTLTPLFTWKVSPTHPTLRSEFVVDRSPFVLAHFTRKKWVVFPLSRYVFTLPSGRLNTGPLRTHSVTGYVTSVFVPLTLSCGPPLRHRGRFAANLQREDSKAGVRRSSKL